MSRHALRAVVEAGEGGEVRPAGLAKRLAGADGDLLQRLEAVGGEARRDHRQAAARRLRASSAMVTSV